MRATTVLRVLLAIQSTLVEGFHFDPDGLVIDVRPRWKLPRCGECGTKGRSLHDSRTRTWRHLDLAGMKLQLRYKIRRMPCARCGTVKTEQTPWARPSSRFTYAFEERIAYLAQQSSKTAVVNLMRIAWRTVGWIIQRVVTSYQDHAGDSLDGLRLIGVDELSYMRHHKYVTVVVDHERACVVWASEGKSAKTLKRFFDELGEERCSLLEAVTIDMSQPYIKAVTEATPGARLIFDRFHVQRLAHNALDETRRDEVRAAKTEAAKKDLKGTRWSLQKSEWNLTDSDVLTLKQLAVTNKPIYHGYLLKAELVAILDGKQPNVARARLLGVTPANETSTYVSPPARSRAEWTHDGTQTTHPRTDPGQASRRRRNARRRLTVR